MKRAYLVDTLPEQFSSKYAPADIKQKLDSYRMNKSEMINEAPEIKPSPFEKYTINKVKEIRNNNSKNQNQEEQIKPIDLQSSSSNTGIELSKSDIEELTESLPKNLRSRARKLLPFVLQINYGDLDLKDLLYDLTNKKSKNLRSHNIALLDSVIQQLNKNPRVPKDLYVQKYSESISAPEVSSSAVATGRSKSLPLRSKPSGLHTSRRDQFIRNTNQQNKNLNWI